MRKRFTSIALVLFFSLALVSFLFFFLASTANAQPPAQEGESTTPYPNPDEALVAAVNWLIEMHQNTDGGFTSFSIGADQAPSDVGGTLDALIAVAAAQAETDLILDYLSSNIDDLITFAASDGGTAGKTVFALILAGQDPSDFEGHDFVIDITNHISPTGAFGVTSAFNQSFAILGLALAGEPVPTEAIDWLVSLQSDDEDILGSWDDGFGTLANADSTAMAVMALRVVGQDVNSDEIVAALDFLVNTKLPTGGWEYGPGFGENSNSIALVIQAAIVSAEDIYAPDSRWMTGDFSPVEALLSWQSESGAFQADFGEGRFDDYFSTIQSIPALAMIDRTATDSNAQEMTPTPTVTLEPVLDEVATELPPEDPTQEVPTDEPEPTVAPLPTATPEAVADVSGNDDDGSQVTDSDPESEGGSGIASGDSILPFIVVGLVLLIIIAFFAWLFRSRS
jgi:hypothetical protein